MALYLYQAAYTAESIAAQVRNPVDRIAAVNAMVAEHGVKIMAGGYSFGEFDVTAIFEAVDDGAAAAFVLALAAGGAIRSARTTKLLDGHQWVQALTAAGRIASSYVPAR